jgi:hypothetical protein
MAKKANRDVEQFSYVLAADQQLPVEEQSSFKFRPLTQGERMRVLDGMEVVVLDPTGGRQVKPCGMQQAYEAVLLTLVAVGNFPIGEPAPYPVEKGRDVRALYIDQLADADVFELGMYVIDRSTLGPPEKNSSTP